MSFSPVLDRLNKQNTDVDHLSSAYGFLVQAENHLRRGYHKKLMEFLGKVNTSATYALYSSGTNKVDELVMAAKLLILVDVFSQSIITTKDGHIKLVPIHDDYRTDKQNLAVHVTSHLHMLMKMLDKKSLPMDGLRKVLTLNYGSEDAQKVSETFDKCVQLVDPKTEIIDEDTIILTLPPLNIIPDVGGESHPILKLRFPGADGSTKHSLSLCVEERERDKFLNIGYFGIIYSLTLRKYNCAYGDSNYAEDDEIIDVKIEGTIITDASSGSDFKRYRDMTDMEFEGSFEIWTPRDIQCVAPSVECGDVTSVKCLTLCCDEPTYTMADIYRAREIVKVAKSLFVSVTSLPEEMSWCGHWNGLANGAGEMDNFTLIGNLNDDEAMYGMGEECEKALGELVARAKKAGLINIKIPDFGLFSETVANEQEAGRNNCGEIGFKWNSENNMQEQVKELMEKIGWKMKENPCTQYDVVIVK